MNDENELLFKPTKLCNACCKKCRRNGNIEGKIAKIEGGSKMKNGLKNQSMTTKKKIMQMKKRKESGSIEMSNRKSNLKESICETTKFENVQENESFDTGLKDQRSRKQIIELFKSYSIKSIYEALNMPRKGERNQLMKYIEIAMEAEHMMVERLFCEELCSCLGATERQIIEITKLTVDDLISIDLDIRKSVVKYLVTCTKCIMAKRCETTEERHCTLNALLDALKNVKENVRKVANAELEKCDYLTLLNEFESDLMNLMQK
ncbi:hypothetical protein ACOME3_000796 [Neoechinorhynchus agilis]